MGESTYPVKTSSRAHCDYALDFTNPELSYANCYTPYLRKADIYWHCPVTLELSGEAAGTGTSAALFSKGPLCHINTLRGQGSLLCLPEFAGDHLRWHLACGAWGLRFSIKHKDFRHSELTLLPEQLLRTQLNGRLAVSGHDYWEKATRSCRSLLGFNNHFQEQVIDPTGKKSA